MTHQTQSRVTADGSPERPDHTAAAFAAFLAKLDDRAEYPEIRAAFFATFGGEFRVVKARARR